MQRLARLRRPALADVTLIAHVFATSYAAVERELPALIARHKPDALLMFGLAPRAKLLRVETRARNALALLPDVGGQCRAPRQDRARRTLGTRAAGAGAPPATHPACRARAGRAVARCRALSLQLPHLARGRSRRQAGRPAPGRLHPRAQYPPRPAPPRAENPGLRSTIWRGPEPASWSRSPPPPAVKFP